MHDPGFQDTQHIFKSSSCPGDQSCMQRSATMPAGEPHVISGFQAIQHVSECCCPGHQHRRLHAARCHHHLQASPDKIRCQLQHRHRHVCILRQRQRTLGTPLRRAGCCAAICGHEYNLRKLDASRAASGMVQFTSARLMLWAEHPGAGSNECVARRPAQLCGSTSQLLHASAHMQLLWL